MKKLIIIFIGMITMLTVGCGHGSIEEISFSDYKQMVENKESFILFIGSSTCSHCAEFKITLQEVIENYNVDFKYIDIANFTPEERTSFSNSISFDGTPTTVFIVEGVDNSCTLFSCDKTKRIEGAQSYQKTIEMLKNNGYIKG